MPFSAIEEVRNMNKEKYEHIELEIIKFKTEDVIATSNPDDEYEGEMVNHWISDWSAKALENAKAFSEAFHLNRQLVERYIYEGDYMKRIPDNFFKK